eukprot:TRINITY_DN3889_c0_g1_i1.p1 TRINITY_DN3889_c0_g1~~TRINITY_DN3889_c0_g1_i1.p1  ORF type:complete len:345 (-),score=71.33 TRINITY_DN3889_c0_g1_i1:86-1120(-)
MSFSLGSLPVIREGLIDAIGKTPLIKLANIGKETGCTILGKAEFLNPGGSVKDRAALWIIQSAINDKRLKTGGTVVEGTAGNTGIGMAHVCKALGLNCLIYMPNTQSMEKISLLRALGAEVRPVPAVPYDDPNNYNHIAKREAEKLGENAIWGNQFDNTENKTAHYMTTGPEIWAQTGGKIDGWVTSTGTGGTFSGVAQFLKEKNPKIKTFVADPPGSVLYKYFTEGKLERTGASSITEGIGQGRITNNMKDALCDGALHITDERSIDMVYRLLSEEGLYVGASSALNVVAALDLAKILGPGHTIVTILCDGAGRYQSRLFSKEWLNTKGLLKGIPEKYHGLLV